MDKYWEDIQHGMSPLSGGREYVKRSVQEEGHGGRTHVQGASEGIGIIQGVRSVDGGRITDESSDDSTWKGGGDTAAMENLSRRGRATEFPNDFTGKRRPAEMPGGGMPGPSGKEDGNAGALPAPECPRHHGHSGGGKLPPPMVRPMQHYGPPAGPERQTP